MNAMDVLSAAADLPVDDEHYRAAERGWGGRWDGKVREGGGLICALRSAAGSELEAYNEAYAVLSEYCDRVVPLVPADQRPRPKYERGREHGEVRSWAIGRTDDERRSLLRQAAFKLAGGLA